MGGGGGGGDEREEGGGDGRRPKTLHLRRLGRFSPVSITHALCERLDGKLLVALPVCTRSLLFVYTDLVRRNMWNALFHSGRGVGPGSDPTAVRKLASRHLNHPSVDGWNVVAGATALAQAWALSASEQPSSFDRACTFAKATRVRLAVCLSVAWKFERCLCTHFPRRFHSSKPNLFSPHTHELAYLGYSFLTLEEQTAFGPWDDDNVAKIRALYTDMVALEANLLISVNVMALLTRHTQVLAEDRIAKLLEAHVLDSNAAMAVRAVVPFFRMASQDGKSAPPTAGALVCAAMLCLSVPTTVRAYVLHCHDVVRTQFTCSERRGAFAALEQATHLEALSRETIATTCYRDETWVHYPFVCSDALRVALCTAREACA